jgi:dTDP-4-amino-4,6-dideoxygalactose transaminase
MVSGNHPSRPSWKIPYSRIVCDGRELDYVREVLESGWLTTASKAQAFEEAFTEVVGARFTYAVNSCTSALHLGLEALGVQAGDRVLVPTMTFTASADVIRYLDADPLFFDVEYGSGLVTPGTHCSSIYEMT